MTTRFLLRLARMIDARPGKIAVAFLLAAVASGVVVARIPVRTDLLDVLPEGNPTIQAFRGFLDDFGMMDGLVLVVSSRDPSPEALATAVEAIGEELSASSRVASVDYNLFRSGGGLVARTFPGVPRRAGSRAALGPPHPGRDPPTDPEEPGGCSSPVGFTPGGGSGFPEIR